MSELTDKERDLAQRMADNPLDVFQGKSLGWLEDFIRITVGTTKNWTPPVGSPLILLKDLTAETGEFVYTDESGVNYIFWNGAEVSQTTYANLYTFVGPNAFGTDAGGNFFLGDARGRSLFFCGTNANADLGDNDNQTVANRQPYHQHGDTLAISGAPAIGNLAVSGTFGSSTHTHDVTTANVQIPSTGPPTNVANHQVYTSSGPSATASPSLSGAPSAGTLAVSGSVGSGMVSDGPAHLFIGSLLVRF